MPALCSEDDYVPYRGVTRARNVTHALTRYLRNLYTGALRGAELVGCLRASGLTHSSAGLEQDGVYTCISDVAEATGG